MGRRGTFALLAAGALSAACRQPPPPTAGTIRLVDIHRPGPAAPAAASSPARTEWRFERKDHRWTALDGIAALTVRDGRLTGRATTAVPILHYTGDVAGERREPVHAIELRMRVSAGSTAAIELEGGGLEREQAIDIVRNLPLDFVTPLTPGPDVQTYTLRTQLSIVAGDARHLFVRPTDAPGATFEIESIRLVTRSEHLETVPSGVAWQGLSEVYKETIVVRAPETQRYEVTLPERPLLDLAVGTIEEGPIRFRVAVEPEGGEARAVFERTITRPHRWDPAAVDLAPWAGKKVALTLTAEGDRPGAVAFWGAPAVRSRVEGAGRRPQGVVLVMVDTLRRDHIGAYGYPRPTTPSIDRLAREGAIFRDCVGQATWTKVAAPSLLTSLYPSAHTVADFPDRLPSAANTLAEAYRAAGYATLSLSSILFTGRFSNLHQGFEEVHEDSSLTDRGSTKTSREYVDRLLPWLEAHRDVPFFVFLHVADPHDPYKPLPPYDTMWADASRTEAHERRVAEVRKRIADPLLRNMGVGMPTREDLVRAAVDPEDYIGHERDWYDGSIRGLDAEIGRLVERLRALGLDRRTLVAFTADHGEEFLEHGRMLHGQSVYGELTRVPLVFYGGGVPRPGLVIDEPVRSIDLMPTLLHLFDLRAPAHLQGQSLVPLLRAAAGMESPGDDWVRRPIVSQKVATEDERMSPPPRKVGKTAISDGRWKLVHN